MADQSIQKFEESTLNGVLQRVTQFQESGSIDLPKDYSVGNALRSAWLVLQNMTDSKTGTPILQHVTRSSVANAMLDMVTQGLNVAKKQGAFVRYGDQLTFQREYFGTIALAKRYAGLKAVHGNVVYKDDEFEVETDLNTGRKRLSKHKQQIGNIDPAKMIGAYAVIILEDGTSFIEVMSMAQIKTSWGQGQAKGNSPAHTNFPDQMAIKTVINRALKILVSSSDDSVLMEPRDGQRAEPVELMQEATVVEEPGVISIDSAPPAEPEPPAPSSGKSKPKENPF